MPPIFAGASRGAVTRMVCPFCGEIQARARGPEGTTYACRACGKTFTDAEGRRGEGGSASTETSTRARPKHR